MTEFNFNQTIEYIDGTRDLNFEEARRWAQSHGASFEEDIDKREPYEDEHEETYMNPETGASEVRTVSTPTIKRFFVIGDEPKPIVIEPTPIIEPTVEELQANKRSERALIMQSVQNRIDRYRNQKELGVETADDEDTFKVLLGYMQYLRDFTKANEWWDKQIPTFDEWKSGE